MLTLISTASSITSVGLLNLLKQVLFNPITLKEGEMQEGGDRGKGPNKTGTQPKSRVKETPDKPGNKDVKGGAGRSAAKATHAATKARGVKTSETRKAGPKKIAAGTTTKSGDKKGGAKKHSAKTAPTKESKTPGS
jgi:hypothetical protein